MNNLTNLTLQSEERKKSQFLLMSDAQDGNINAGGKIQERSVKSSKYYIDVASSKSQLISMSKDGQGKASSFDNVSQFNKSLPIKQQNHSKL